MKCVCLSSYRSRLDPPKRRLLGNGRPSELPTAMKMFATMPLQDTNSTNRVTHGQTKNQSSSNRVPVSGIWPGYRPIEIGDGTSYMKPHPAAPSKQALPSSVASVDAPETNELAITKAQAIALEHPLLAPEVANRVSNWVSQSHMPPDINADSAIPDCLRVEKPRPKPKTQPQQKKARGIKKRVPAIRRPSTAVESGTTDSSSIMTCETPSENPSSARYSSESTTLVDLSFPDETNSATPPQTGLSFDQEPLIPDAAVSANEFALDNLRRALAELVIEDGLDPTREVDSASKRFSTMSQKSPRTPVQGDAVEASSITASSGPVKRTTGLRQLTLEDVWKISPRPQKYIQHRDVEKARSCQPDNLTDQPSQSLRQETQVSSTASDVSHDKISHVEEMPSPISSSVMSPDRKPPAESITHSALPSKCVCVERTDAVLKHGHGTSASPHTQTPLAEGTTIPLPTNSQSKMIEKGFGSASSKPRQILQPVPKKVVILNGKKQSETTTAAAPSAVVKHRKPDRLVQPAIQPKERYQIEALAIYNALKSTLDSAQGFPGFVSLEFQIGQILVPSVPRQIYQEPLSMEQWNGIFNPINRTPTPSAKFFPGLTAHASEIESLLQITAEDDPDGSRLFENQIDYGVIFEYHCRSSDGRSFVIVIDEAGNVSVREVDCVLGAVHVHIPEHVWDVRAAVRGIRERRRGDNRELDTAVDQLVQSIWVQPHSSRVRIFCRVPASLRVEKVLMRRWTRRDACLDRRIAHSGDEVAGILLKITEVQDLLIGTHPTNPHILRARNGESQEMVRQGRIWFEAAIVSPAIDTVLETNRSLELGERTTVWASEDILGDEYHLAGSSGGQNPIASAIGESGIGQMYRVATAIARRIDHIGDVVDEDDDGKTMGSISSYSQNGWSSMSAGEPQTALALTRHRAGDVMSVSGQGPTTGPDYW